MSGNVFAEKYRPKKIEDVVGQEHIVPILKGFIQNKTIPLLTTKKIPWKTCLRELLWFMRGETNNESLLKDNIHIWSGNASREFLDSRGLQQLAVNDLGPIYGHQWRHFNAPYLSCKNDYSGKGVDQIQNIIDALKDEKERNSRRL